MDDARRLSLHSFELFTEETFKPVIRRKPGRWENKLFVRINFRLVAVLFSHKCVKLYRAIMSFGFVMLLDMFYLFDV